jgi:hypothetical protein
MSKEDRQLNRIGAIVGVVIFVVILLAVVLPFVLVRSSPNSSVASEYDGYASAPQITIPNRPSPASIQRTCEVFYSEGLSGDDLNDRRGPFVAGCVRGMEDRIRHRYPS